MNEKSLQILEQYDLTLKNSYGGRGSIILETEQGIKTLKEFVGSRTRIPYEQEILQCLEEHRICYTDRVVLNKEEEPISLDEYQTPYYIQNWYPFKECDTRTENDLIKSMKVLGQIHRTLREDFKFSEEGSQIFRGIPRVKEFEKRTKELKRVQNFMRAKQRKGDFELLYLKYAEGILEKAREIQRKLEDSLGDNLYQKACEESYICHGEYIHHNILFHAQEVAVINTHHFEINVQVNDIILFMRKIMEKQDWKEELAKKMLESYEKELPLTKEEKMYLSVCLSYPEKAWKLVHHYYHSNKAWIPGKSVEKLQHFLSQEEKREEMIKGMFLT